MYVVLLLINGDIPVFMDAFIHPRPERYTIPTREIHYTYTYPRDTLYPSGIPQRPRTD